MGFDPTISLGAILSALAICVTIVTSVVAAYMGVTRHMTKTEGQILAMLERLEKVERKQEAQGGAIGKLQAMVAAAVAKIEMLYEMAKRRRTSDADAGG